MATDRKVALVTGAGSGIGQASAIFLAEQGFAVAALGRQGDPVDETVATIEDRGGQGLALYADISDEGQMRDAVSQIEDQWGRLDVVFANAGINGVWAPVDELKLEEWEQTLRVNLTGTFLTVKSSLDLLKKQGGSIIITSSVNGTRNFSLVGASAYSTSKAGQVAFSRMIALELAKYKIRVNTICPGSVTTNIMENTEQRDREDEVEPVEFPEGKVPLTDGRPARPFQVARLVGFLASDASDHISGTEVWIDGAESLLVG